MIGYPLDSPITESIQQYGHTVVSVLSFIQKFISFGSKNFQAVETAALFVILQCFLVVAGKLVSFYIVGHFLLLR